MSEYALLCIDTQSGRCTRYVKTRLWGMKTREAGAVDIIDYNRYFPVRTEIREMLDTFRKDGTLG